jgi:hypothetical protein
MSKLGIDLNQTIAETFGHERRRAGGVGIEVEAEYQIADPGAPGGPLPRTWRSTRDGSLRNGAEFVTRGVVPEKNVEGELQGLYEYFDRNAMRIQDSVRASTHLHFNVTQMTWRETMLFLVSYWLLEEVLISRYCGEERLGNLFCLPLRDAPYPLELLVRYLQGEGDFPRELDGGQDNLKYASVNVGCLSRLGSLEFRPLRTPAEGPGAITQWFSILQSVRDNALRHFRTPVDLMSQLSGPEDVGGVAELLVPGLALTDEEKSQVQQSVWEVQPLCFQVRWE